MKLSKTTRNAFIGGFAAGVEQMVEGMRAFSELPAAGNAAQTFREYADGIEKMPLDNIMNRWVSRHSGNEPESS